MKKLFTLTLVVGLLLTFTACENTPIDSTPTTTEPPIVTTTTATEERPTETVVLTNATESTTTTTTTATPITTTTTASPTTTTAATATTTTVTTTKASTTTTRYVPEVRPSYISKEEAVRIALEHAKFSRSDVRDIDVEFDYERDVPTYDVDFEVDNIEYSYMVDAETGAVYTHHKRDPINSTGVGSASQTSPKPVGITYAVAKNLALKHAGVSADTIRDFEAELDTEDGVYDINFESDKWEYDYEIDAKTGTIVKHEKERRDD